MVQLSIFSFLAAPLEIEPKNEYLTRLDNTGGTEADSYYVLCKYTFFRFRGNPIYLGLFRSGILDLLVRVCAVADQVRSFRLST